METIYTNFVKVRDVHGSVVCINRKYITQIETNGYKIFVRGVQGLYVELDNKLYTIEEIIAGGYDLLRESKPKVEEKPKMEKPQPAKKGVNRPPLPEENTKERARLWVACGGRVSKRYGWGWKGAEQQPISEYEAMELLPKYDFGKGFYMLTWTYYEDMPCLCFNELSENDME